MALIPPFFLDCVVAIGFDTPDGRRGYAATGFLYGKFLAQVGEKRSYRIFLVTQQHVFEDVKVAWLRFNPEGDEPAREFELPLFDENKAQIWLSYPDPEVDLAVVGISARFLREQSIRFAYFRSDEHVVSRVQASELGISEGDGVFVLGFPMGIIGEKRNFIIVRQGAVARIVSNYVPYQDVAISTQTRRPRIIFEENSGLAAVVPADYLIEIIDTATTTEAGMQELPIEVSPSAPEEPAA